MIQSTKAFFKAGCLLTLLSSSPLLLAHDENPLTEFFSPANMIAKVQFKNYQQEMKKLNALHLDIAGVDFKNQSAEVIINDTQFEKLKSLGFDVTMTMSKSLMRGPDAEYKTPEKIEALLKDFHQQYPSLTELKAVGKSLRGQTIWAIKISSSNAIKPTVLFNGMHHAREVMGPEVALDIIETLLSGYGKDSKITHWVDANNIWVLPMFNVDGNSIVWNSDSMWRKNARDSYGVDLNRNYPEGWGSCNGSSAARWAQDYRGPAPASEPETNVMMNFVKEIRPVFDISYHSYSELVLYPKGCKGLRTQNADVVETIGKEMGQKLGYTAGTPWETLYSADGSDIDWMYGAYQVIPYVIELNSSRDGFQPDYSRRQPTVELNRKAWQHLLDRLDGSGIRGTLTVNGKAPADFKVLLQKKSASGYQDYMTYVGNPNGSFQMVTNAGDYRLIISGKDFQATTKDVSVGTSRVEISLAL